MQLRCARTPGRGFSLIELLIVLAIIGLLAALTLPSLALARSSARQITCASNQRQLGLAAQMYADNHDGTVLMNYTPTSSGAYATWDLTLLPYALNGKTATSVFGNPMAQIPRPLSVFACPASDDPATPDEVSDYAKNNSFNGVPRGTEINDPFPRNMPGGFDDSLASDPTFVWEKNALRIWQITKPQQTFLLTDSATRDLDQSDTTTAIGRHDGNDSADATGSLNMLFYDGHVRQMDKAVMQWDSATAAPWLPYSGY